LPTASDWIEKSKSMPICSKKSSVTDTSAPPKRARPLPPRITPCDLERHAALVATLGENALWNKP